MSRVGVRRLLVTVAVAGLGLATSNHVALAQARGGSGLPPGPGNPLADLQRQIDALQQQVNAIVGAPSAVAVDCGAGQTVSGALAATAGPVTITVTGTCTENVVVTRDDVVLQGTPGAGITAASGADPVIRLDGARRVRVSGLALTGGDSGLQGTRGATWDLAACTVQGGARFGVLATNGSIGTVDGCTVSGSGGQGVVAASQAALYLTNSTVEHHAGNGVVATRGSHVRVGQDIGGSGTLKPVTVRNNGQNGVSITESSAGIVVGGAVENNGNTGIFVGRSSAGQIGMGSLGLMGGVAVRGNGHAGIWVESSQATILGSTISGNADAGIGVSNGAGSRIGITDGSTAYVGNTISGNASNGIHVTGAASAFIGGNTIDANGTNPGAALGRNGIGVFNASVHLAGRNTISNNPGSGLFAARAAGALVGDTGFGLPVSGPDANVISGNGAGVPGNRAGVFAFQGGTVDVRDARIDGNFGAGVQAFEGGIVDVRRTRIENSVFVTPGFDGGHGIVAGLHSVLRLRDNTAVTGNAGNGVQVFSDSGVDFRNDPVPALVAANGLVDLECFGAESSYSGNTSNVASISGGCTSF